jgi:hypothetical protein
VADRLAIHQQLLLATFVTSTLARVSTAAAHSFAVFGALAVAAELLAAPVGVMADAAVVAACHKVRAACARQLVGDAHSAAGATHACADPPPPRTLLHAPPHTPGH